MTEVTTTLRSAYLAGPMRGIQDFNFPAFKRAARWLRDNNWVVYSPAERDEQDPMVPDNQLLAQQGHDWSGTHDLAFFMTYDLAAVCSHDAIIMLPGWEESQGARLEATVAIEVGHPVFEITGKGGLFLQDWDDLQLTSVDPEYVQAVFADKSMGIYPVWTGDTSTYLNDQGVPEMRSFETGATRNKEVDPDYEGFLSPLAQHRFGQYMHAHRLQADGTTRDSDNWQKGIPIDSYMKSLRRHEHDLQLHHDGYGQLARGDIWDALSGLFFNVQGYMHELAKLELKDDDYDDAQGFA